MAGRDGCPRCGHDAFFHVETVESPNYEYNNSMRPLGLSGFYGPTGETGLFGGSKSARQVVEMTAYVCKACRHAVLFVKDLAVLEQMEAAGQGVVSVTGLPG